MSGWFHIVSVLLFLAYSVGYLVFVAWASDKSAGTNLRLQPWAPLVLFGAVLPWLGYILLVVKT